MTVIYPDEDYRQKANWIRNDLARAHAQASLKDIPTANKILEEALKQLVQLNQDITLFLLTD